jgi:hypothetical protein
MSARIFAIGEKMVFAHASPKHEREDLCNRGKNGILSCNAYPVTLPADNLSKTHPGKEKAPAVVSPVCGE